MNSSSNPTGLTTVDIEDLYRLLCVNHESVRKIYIRYLTHFLNLSNPSYTWGLAYKKLLLSGVELIIKDDPELQDKFASLIQDIHSDGELLAQLDDTEKDSLLASLKNIHDEVLYFKNTKQSLPQKIKSGMSMPEKKILSVGYNSFVSQLDKKPKAPTVPRSVLLHNLADHLSARGSDFFIAKNYGSAVTNYIEAINTYFSIAANARNAHWGESVSSTQFNLAMAYNRIMVYFFREENFLLALAVGIDAVKTLIGVQSNFQDKKNQSLLRFVQSNLLVALNEVLSSYNRNNLPVSLTEIELFKTAFSYVPERFQQNEMVLSVAKYFDNLIALLVKRGAGLMTLNADNAYLFFARVVKELDEMPAQYWTPKLEIQLLFVLNNLKQLYLSNSLGNLSLEVIMSWFLKAKKMITLSFENPEHQLKLTNFCRSFAFFITEHAEMMINKKQYSVALLALKAAHVELNQIPKPLQSFKIRHAIHQIIHSKVRVRDLMMGSSLPSALPMFFGGRARATSAPSEVVDVKYSYQGSYQSK